MKCSKRKWDNMVASWRRALHAWDDNPHPDKMTVPGKRTHGELGATPVLSLPDFRKQAEAELASIADFVNNLKSRDIEEVDSDSPEEKVELQVASRSRREVSLPLPKESLETMFACIREHFDVSKLSFQDPSKTFRTTLQTVDALAGFLKLNPRPKLYYDPEAESPDPTMDRMVRGVDEDNDVARELQDTPTRGLLLLGHDAKFSDLVFSTSVVIETPHRQPGTTCTPNFFFCPASPLAVESALASLRTPSPTVGA
jgi:hypothetical protein